MALVTVQRSPTPSTIEDELSDDVIDVADCLSPGTSHRSPRQRCLSESYFVVRGAALILPRKECPSAMDPSTSNSGAGGEIQLHLQAMLHLLRPEDTLKMAVKLETLINACHTRYLAIISTTGRQDNSESIILGIDYVSSEKTTIGLYLPIESSTKIALDGDGRIQVESAGNLHIFKPVSVQAMWSAFQSLHKEQDLSREAHPSGPTHAWVEYYRVNVNSPEAFKVQWNYTYPEKDLQVDAFERFMEKPPERKQAETKIRNALRVIMHSVDLDDVTTKDIREKLTGELKQDLTEYKGFIDSEMLVILGQLDKPSQIFHYLYLGTEWNASNYDELKSKNIGYILNVTKEVDNFFPNQFKYKRISVSDEESTELMKFWDSTFSFIKEAQDANKAVLVHCKKGISRSSSTVIAYIMKERTWRLDDTIEYVKKCRNCITPNRGFLEQLKTFEGILVASKHREKYNAQCLNTGVGSKSEPMLNSQDSDESDTLRERSESDAQDMHSESNLDDNCVDYNSMTSHFPNINSGHPGLLVASENILRSTPVTKQTVDDESKRLSFDIKEEKEMDCEGLEQNARPPIGRHLQCVERSISLKGAGQVTLKHVQNIVLQPKRRSKLHPSDSSSGNSSDCSLSLTSSGDEADGDWIKERRNSKSSSGGSTGDSAVVDVEMNLSSSPANQPTTNGLLLDDINNTGSMDDSQTNMHCSTSSHYFTTPGQVSRYKQQYETNGQEKTVSSEKSAPSKRKHKLFGLFTRRDSSTNIPPPPESISSKECDKDCAISSEGHRKGAKLTQTQGRHPSLKVSQPGQVKQQKEKLERRSQQDDRSVSKSSLKNSISAMSNDYVQKHSESAEKVVKKNKDKMLEFAAEEPNNVRSLARKFEIGSNHNCGRNTSGSERTKGRLRRPSWRPRSLQRVMLMEPKDRDAPSNKHELWRRKAATT